MKVSVITVSDRASRGEYEDLSGPEIIRMILNTYPDAEVRRTVVPDEKKDILRALESSLDCGFIVTAGGTGISPRDITPEVSRAFCEKELPGISEILRAESYKETANAILSRGYAGIRGRSIIVNFPGSLNAVRTCLRVMIPVMIHAEKMLDGDGH